jgi:hypothetical protein
MAISAVPEDIYEGVTLRSRSKKITGMQYIQGIHCKDNVGAIKDIWATYYSNMMRV